MWVAGLEAKINEKRCILVASMTMSLHSNRKRKGRCTYGVPSLPMMMARSRSVRSSYARTRIESVKGNVSAIFSLRGISETATDLASSTEVL